MIPEHIFTIQKKTITISSIDTLAEFSRYRSSELKFIEGLVLAEDLISKADVTLYTKGTKITPARLTRLIKLKNSQKIFDSAITLIRNKTLITTFREELNKRIEHQFNSWLNTKKYRDLFFEHREEIKKYIVQFLSDDDFVLEIYKLLFFCESAKVKRSILFFNHAINVALFSAAIALSPRYCKVVGKDTERIIDFFKAGMFHNYGALDKIDKILDSYVEERYRMYLEANRAGYSQLSSINLGTEVIDAISLICEYFVERKDFLEKDDWTSTIANITLVAEIFLRQESGLFAVPHEPRDLIDQMNVEMTNKNLNKRAVQVLTLGLNLQDIFDFYEELDYLIKECIHGNSGFPYPLIGFNSPTFFICKNYVKDCEYIEGSIKAVNPVKLYGDLMPGHYHRCWLLTPKLITFYKDHYKEIKKTAHDEKSNETKSEK